MAYPDIVEAAVAKKIRALWIIATNPIVSFPNLDVLKQGLETLEFLVVQDGFHPTPTSELAHLVLPARNNTIHATDQIPLFEIQG